MLYTPTISEIRKNLIFYDFKIKNNLIEQDDMIIRSNYLLIFKICDSDKIINLKNKFELIHKFELSNSCFMKRK